MNTQNTSAGILEEELATVSILTGTIQKSDIEFLDVGWDSRVFHVKKSNLYFKFPRSKKIQNRYTQEIAALKLAASIEPNIAFPRILFEDPSNRYVGYKGVGGMPLTKVISNLSMQEKQRVGEQIGSFLKLFHDQTVPGARHITAKDEIRQLHEWYNKGAPTLREELNKTEQKRLEELVYEEWPRQLLEFSPDPGLCHGDLHFPNIFIGKHRGLGIIDFGDVGYYDRSKDFIDLDDEAIFETALKTYGDSPELRKKIELRKQLIQIITFTYYLGKNDRAGMSSSLDTIRAKL